MYRHLQEQTKSESQQIITAGDLNWKTEKTDNYKSVGKFGRHINENDILLKMIREY